MDNNPHLHDQTFYGLPVVNPEDMRDEIEAVYLALHPRYHYRVRAELLSRNPNLAIYPE